MSAEARHRIANLLHTYTEIADRKDVGAAVALLGDSVVTFPADGYATRADAPRFFDRLWAGDTVHRHDVSNLIVHPDIDGTWSATAHYSRYLFSPDPILTTLGEYALKVVEDDREWRIGQLTVTRTWSL